MLKMHTTLLKESLKGFLWILDQIIKLTLKTTVYVSQIFVDGNVTPPYLSMNNSFQKYRYCQFKYQNRG